MVEGKISAQECSRVRSRLMLFFKTPKVLKEEKLKEIEKHLEVCARCKYLFREIGGKLTETITDLWVL